MQIESNCAECGAPFIVTSRRRRFCSSRCCGLAHSLPHDAFEGIRWNSETPAERFWLRTNQDGPTPGHVPELGQCWIWTGTSNHNGYGRLIVHGKPISAHRFSWNLHYGEIPPKFFVCHRCDTPACVRPDHLFLGTGKDNAQDCTTKARWRPARGESGGQAVLTENEVLMIRDKYASDRTSYNRLAREFGVSQSEIALIIRRLRWSHI